MVEPRKVLLPDDLLGGLQALLVVGEGRVSQVYVGVDRLLEERLEGLALLLGPLYELLHNAPVGLGLVAKLLYGVVHKPLREAHVALLQPDGVIQNRPERISRGLGEPLRSLVSLVHVSHCPLLLSRAPARTLVSATPCPSLRAVAACPCRAGRKSPWSSGTAPATWPRSLGRPGQRR